MVSGPPRRHGDPSARGHDPLPADAWAHAVAGARTPEADRSERQRAGVALAARLVGELADADAVLLAVPLYKLGVSEHIKTWMNLVIAAPRDDEPELRVRAAAGGQADRSGRRAVGLTGAGRHGKAGTTPPAACGASSPTCGVPN